MLYHVYEYLRIILMAKPRTQRGASAVEYGLLIALIGIVIVIAVTSLGSKLSTIFKKTATSIPS